MRDFTLINYNRLLQTFLANGYSFQSFKDHSLNSEKKVVVLRHDIDRMPVNALAIAKIENYLDISASYYFRIVRESYNVNIIKQIADMGHEIGYHYEDLSLCNGDYETAIKHFELNLEKFRKIYPVKTICMHGSPLSKWDNRDLWEKYNYRDFGIIAEPYFDIDFNNVFYLTDAGRSWNNENVSIRDKVKSNFKFNINSTDDIILFIENEKLPDKLMISTHPHNWAKNKAQWMKIFLWQNVKNVIKRSIIHWRLFFDS